MGKKVLSVFCEESENVVWPVIGHLHLLLLETKESFI